MTEEQFVKTEKLSQIARLALADLEAAENNSLYRINMSHWHSYDREDKVCHLCLAGSTLTGLLDDKEELEFDRLKSKFGEDIGRRIGAILTAIDFLRLGSVRGAIQAFSGVLFASPNSIMEVTDYHQDPVKFKEDFIKVIEYLEAVNE